MDGVIDQIVKEKQSNDKDDSRHKWSLFNQCKSEVGKLIEEAEKKLNESKKEKDRIEPKNEQKNVIEKETEKNQKENTKDEK